MRPFAPLWKVSLSYLREQLSDAETRGAQSNLTALPQNKDAK